MSLSPGLQIQAQKCKYMPRLANTSPAVKNQAKRCKYTHKLVNQSPELQIQAQSCRYTSKELQIQAQNCKYKAKLGNTNPARGSNKNATRGRGHGGGALGPELNFVFSKQMPKPANISPHLQTWGITGGNRQYQSPILSTTM